MSGASPLAPTVLVVEDDPLAVEETRAALAFIPEVDVLVAATLEAARALVRRHRILLAIVDLGLPDGDGLALIAELTRATAQHGASSPVCVIRTIFDDDEQVLRALAAGAQGYLVKGESIALTRQRIAAAMRGEPVISPAIARRLLGTLIARGPSAPPVDTEPDDPLTTRERDVLERIAKGLTVVEVARELSVSDNTVKTHLKAVYRKLGVRTRAGVITAARDRGLL